MNISLPQYSRLANTVMLPTAAGWFIMLVLLNNVYDLTGRLFGRSLETIPDWALFALWVFQSACVGFQLRQHYVYVTSVKTGPVTRFSAQVVLAIGIVYAVIGLLGAGVNSLLNGIVLSSLALTVSLVLFALSMMGSAVIYNLRPHKL